MKHVASRLSAIAAAIFLAGCGMHAGMLGQTPGTASSGLKPMDLVGGPAGSKLNVYLGDAAPNIGGYVLQRLDLGIKEIDAIQDGQTTVLASYDRPRVVNVLAHQDDNGEEIADANIARSEYQQLRIVVDIGSSYAKFKGSPRVPVDFLVNVASQSSAGAGATTVTASDGPGMVDFVLTQPFSIAQEHKQAVRLDFNAFESLAVDQSGDVLSRTSLFVAPIDEMGRVKGRVLNSSGLPVANATIVAVAPDGSIGNSDWTNDKGQFSVGTLRAGTYKLLIYNTYTTAAGRVTIASGQTTSAAMLEGPTITVTGGDAISAGTVAD